MAIIAKCPTCGAVHGAWRQEEPQQVIPMLQKMLGLPPQLEQVTCGVCGSRLCTKNLLPPDSSVPSLREQQGLAPLAVVTA